MECEHCATEEQTLATLAQIAARLLNFYEAAFSSYSITEFEGDSPRAAQPAFSSSSHRITSVVGNLSPVQGHRAGALLSASELLSGRLICVPAQMTLGESTLDASESRMLAKQLLADCLLSLDTSLEDLKVVIEEILHEHHTWQTSSRLVACKTLISQTMNQLAKDIGQLRFEGANVMT